MCTICEDQRFEGIRRIVVSYILPSWRRASSNSACGIWRYVSGLLFSRLSRVRRGRNNLTRTRQVGKEDNRS